MDYKVMDHSSFSDRLDPMTYRDDEVVGVAAVGEDALPGPIDDLYWSYVSERIWRRLLLLGAAYELHFGQVIDPVVDTVLNPVQCQSLHDELSFLKTISNDGALDEAIETLLGGVRKLLAGTANRLVLSPP